MLSTSTITILLAILPGVVSWGSAGHSITAKLAYNLVSPKAQTLYQSFLQSGSEPDEDEYIEVGNWADHIVHDMPWSQGLHFINVLECDDDSCVFDYSRDCIDGRCVAGAITNYTTLLNNNQTDEEAFKFLVHFLGDVHQPLHCAKDSDKGGNTINVIYEDVPHEDSSDFHLHQIWDFAIIEKNVGLEYQDDWGLLADSILNDITIGKYDSEKDSWTNCITNQQLINSPNCSSSWGQESVDTAMKYAYINEDGEEIVEGMTLTDEYGNTRMEVIRKRLAQGGVRLAGILDFIADGGD